MARHFTVALICLCSHFFCWSSVANCRSTDNGYKGRYGRKAPAHYEVVVPRKITESGEFISHVIPHHFKRSYYANRHKRDMNSYDKINYMVPIAGEEHHLELLPNNDVISPAMVIETHDVDGISKSRIRKAEDIQCHYSGKVKGLRNSRAAISTCYGLSGYIRTKRGYYLIEPAAGHDPMSGSGHPHLIYQHEIDREDTKPRCETSGDVAKIIAKRSVRQVNEQQAYCEASSSSTTSTISSTTIADNVKNSSYELHIEVMVVLDFAILKYHKEIDVENYVLTVFNMAHDLFHDAALCTNVNLAIVRLIRLEKEDHELNSAVNKNAEQTLEHFRVWQNMMNAGDDAHPNHHDVAVLLTRIDICGKNDSCELLGASRVGGMCDPENQAAVCEDNGLRLGFVIAHELGHTLAITHDTPDESGCSGILESGLTTVMNPTVSIRTSGWSNCSGRYLKLFINSGLGSCLYDQPTDHSFQLVDILPGVMYGGNFQCQELLGPNAALCNTAMDCENLICYLEDRGCVETHIPAAPGTSCGDKQWCIRGKCVEVGERPGAINGEWSPWSNWSECSRTCGSGVAYQERHCNNPPPFHGGKYCLGEHRRHRICSTEPCNIGEPSFRDVQCAEFNDWVYPEDNKVHTWKSYRMPEENPCVLFCVNDLGSVASLRPRVVDGTTCYYGMRDICINGLCKEIPCDLNLESNAVEDACGICHGDGTSCKLIEGNTHFTHVNYCNESQGKQKFLDIPEESVNIKVEEMVPSNSEIQVRSKDGTTVFIPGNALGMFNVPGSKAWLGMIRSKQEALNIPGPISERITIWVDETVIVKENITLKYSYGIKDTETRRPSFSWDYTDWSRCSANCGPGTNEAIPHCLEKLAGLVEDQYCSNIPKPNIQVRPCEIAPCVPRWMIGDWQPCSNCPKGKRTRVVKCVKPAGEGEGESVIIGDSECAGPKPKESEPCRCMKIKREEIKKMSKDSFNEDICDFSKMNNSIELPARHRTVIDEETPKNLSLNIHLESDDDRHWVGLPEHKANTTQIRVCDEDALKFIHKMQHEANKDNEKI